MNRRSFVMNSSKASLVLSAMSYFDMCKTKDAMNRSNLNISLAQWSLNRAFFSKQLDPRNFAQISIGDYEIDAVEYVNGFYMDYGKDESFWSEMKKRADDSGVTSLLIMVDDEGELGGTDNDERRTSVENHYKWVHAAKILGCHSIRVNAFGEGPKGEVRSALVDGMGRLSEYAAKENINVLIENHGLYSSDAQWIAGIMEEVDMANFGSLPDFGNWCLSAKWGTTQHECDKVYDRYKGVSELMPFAKSVSAKSYKFDEEGNEVIIDYPKMLKVVKDFGYTGYIGIEYEGESLSEPEGIRATKSLLERVWDSL